MIFLSKLPIRNVLKNHRITSFIFQSSDVNTSLICQPKSIRCLAPITDTTVNLLSKCPLWFNE